MDIVIRRQGSTLKVTCDSSQAGRRLRIFMACGSPLQRTFCSAKGSDSPRIKVRFRGPGRTESKCFLQQGIPYNVFEASANAAYFNSQRFKTCVLIWCTGEQSQSCCPKKTCSQSSFATYACQVLLKAFMNSLYCNAED